MPRARATDASLTAAQLAKLLGITEQRIRQWADLGCPQVRKGRYTVAAVFKWRVEREAARVKERTNAGSPLQQKLRAEAELKELQLARERGELMPAEEHAEIVSRIAGGFAAVAAGQLTRFERRAVQATTPAAARVLMQEIHRALMEGAQGLADTLEAEADALELAAQSASHTTGTARAVPPTDAEDQWPAL